MSETKDLVTTEITSDEIKNRIYTIRGTQVILDSDLAELYQIETKNLNKAVSRNIERFPEDFCFQLNQDEFKSLKFQIGTSKRRGGRRFLPYAFTEQGVAMLSGVLHSKIAVKVNISIMRTFISMRRFLLNNAQIFQRLENLETKQIEMQLESDKNFKEIFAKLDEPREKKEILFDSGAFYDAISHLEEVIGSATKSIILIDGYADKSTLDMLSKKKKGVSADIYTYTNISKITQAEISAFNKQYGNLTIHASKNFHDRFLILDRKEFYYIGTSVNGNTGGKISSMHKGSDKEILKHIISMLCC